MPNLTPGTQRDENCTIHQAQLADWVGIDIPVFRTILSMVSAI